MSSRKIIIPKGLVDHPEQNSIIEVSSRLNQSRGNLIAKRRGKKLIAQQLPDWQDSLSQPQNVQNSTFIATPSGCSSKTPPNANATFEMPNNNTLNTSNNTTYYSQNTTDSQYYSALSGDSMSESMRTCYNSALDQTPSQGHLNVSGKNVTIDSNIESNVQINDRMLGNILQDTRRSVEADQSSGGSFVLRRPAKLPNNRPLQQTFSPSFQSKCTYSSSYGGGWSDPDSSDYAQSGYNKTFPPVTKRPLELGATYPPRASAPDDSQWLDDSYSDFLPPVSSSFTSMPNTERGNVRSPCAGAGNATFFGGAQNRTMPRAPTGQLPAENFINNTRNRTGPALSPPSSYRIPPQSPYTIPQASKRNRRVRPGEETFPRSANRSLFETSASSCSSKCSSLDDSSGTRDFPTDESYERNFLPMLASSNRSWSSMEDSSSDWNNYEASFKSSQAGMYNIITPMTPSPKKPTTNQTYQSQSNQNCACSSESYSVPQALGTSYSRANNNRTMPRAAETFNGGSNNITGPVGTPMGYRRPLQSPNTLPRASGRSSRPRYGEDTFPRSANRSLLEESAMSSSDERECACSGPEGSESIVSYSSQVVENVYEED